jgi:purine operon repressor
MNKLKRSARLVEMTYYLLSRPQMLIPLSTFAERYDTAKSSISEDLTIIKEVIELEGYGKLHTYIGASGGVRYSPHISKANAQLFIESLCRQLQMPERILPGGYLYMSDLIGLPMYSNEIGKIFATAFADREIDVVITIETKGIPIAYATATFLNVPVVIVHRDHVSIEGSVVSMNYVSGSNKRIQTMSLNRKALKEQANVVIIDDFMHAGGTIRGMIDLMQEFNAKVVGVGVFAESRVAEELLVDDYVSLVTLYHIDTKSKQIKVEPGNYFKS